MAGLERHGIEADLRVHAVPGARSADPGDQVSSALAAEPDVVVIVIGADDFTHLEPLDPLEPVVHALARAVRQLRHAGTPARRSWSRPPPRTPRHHAVHRG